MTAYVTTPTGQRVLLKAIQRYAPEQYECMRIMAAKFWPLGAIEFTHDDPSVQAKIDAFVAVARAAHKKKVLAQRQRGKNNV